MAQSLLEQARAEGFRNGRNQDSQSTWDDGYEAGQASILIDAPSRFRWWLFGLACGALPVWWLS